MPTLLCAWVSQLSHRLQIRLYELISFAPAFKPGLKKTTTKRASALNRNDWLKAEGTVLKSKLDAVIF